MKFHTKRTAVERAIAVIECRPGAESARPVAVGPRTYNEAQGTVVSTNLGK